MNKEILRKYFSEKLASGVYPKSWTRKDGWCYLSSIMDLHSRRIISHKVGKFMDIKLVIDTLKMAIYKRGDTTNLIIHTDRGSQYMSKEYRKFCAKKGISIS